MAKQIANWNSKLQVWITTQSNLLSEQWVLWQAAWPKSGTTLGGKLYELPMWEHRTDANESSLSPIPEESMLRTPSVTDSTGGARSAKQASARGQMVKTADQIAELAFENGLKVSPAITASLLPTPNTMDYLPARTPEKIAESKLRSPAGYANLREYVVNEIELLRTPLVDDAKNTGHNKTRMATLASQTYNQMDWGKFAPAIHRWESMTRPSPAPTRPDGKNDTHRLNPEFAEWMMGLPAGWITGHGLTRHDELKMAGNGVCPQQAFHAISNLLADIIADQGENNE